MKKKKHHQAKAWTREEVNETRDERSGERRAEEESRELLKRSIQEHMIRRERRSHETDKRKERRESALNNMDLHE